MVEFVVTVKVPPNIWYSGMMEQVREIEFLSSICEVFKWLMASYRILQWAGSFPFNAWYDR